MSLLLPLTSVVSCGAAAIEWSVPSLAASSGMAVSFGWLVYSGTRTDEKGDLDFCCCSEEMRVSVEERVRPAFRGGGRAVDLVGSGEEGGDGVARRAGSDATSSSEGKKIYGEQGTQIIKSRTEKEERVGEQKRTGTTPTSLHELSVNELMRLKAWRRADDDWPLILIHWPCTLLLQPVPSST